MKGLFSVMHLGRGSCELLFDFEMAAVVLCWKSHLNGVQPPSITMLENDFCKLLKYLKHVKTQHELTDRCAKHCISH